MAEIIVSEFAKLVIGQLRSVIDQEVKLLWGMEDELTRIKSNMTSIQSVLRDAEKQQSTVSTSESVKNWLEKLHDVMYDIDDLLDDIATEAAIQDMNKEKWSKKVRKFFSCTNSLVLRSQWAHQIKNLRKKLDWIKDERNGLVLCTESGDSTASRETYSKVNKSDILGRDADKEAIINLILSCGDCERLSVLPVVGFGGVGKSTIVKLIYSDHRIDEHFDKKFWVYVSKNFDVKKILNQILSFLTGESILKITMEIFTLEELMIKINEALKSSKYLLILDDLWNEDSNKWRRFKELMDVGAKGSMVVVTTRDLKVASMVSDDVYKLRELSNETCLLIFKQLAFKDGERIEPTLWNLATNIVEKSMGLPLLVTTLGNLLHGETDEQEWHLVIQKLEKGHEDILNILKLSYDQLPSNLKLCFRICSIWGKGGEANPWFHLSPFLMALGFLPYDIQGEQPEYIGRKFINELLSKSLLQQVEEIEAIHDMFSSISMHDFVYDLAKSMAGDELAIINCSTKEVPEKVRYIRLEEDDLSTKQCHKKLLSKAKKARLLLISTSGHTISKALMESIITNLKCLRVLHLRFCQFEELPRTIGYMKHLRYLNLVGNSKIERLPDSVCNLFNLQTLLLGGCSNLQELPADIGRLQNLRCFSVTTQQQFLPEDIGLMNALRTLVLYECPRLAFLPTSIKSLENLDSLWITGCKELDMVHGSWSSEDCLNSLRSLVIEGLPKFTRLPICENGVSFTSLQILEVTNCEGLTELTGWIEYLTSLKTLSIDHCFNLVELPHSFQLLDRLERLIIFDCPILSERCAPGNGQDWYLISRIPWIEIDGEIINLE